MTEPWTRDPLVREDAELRALLDRLASTASDPVDPATRAATLERVLRAASTRAAAPAVPAWRRRAQQVLAMTGAKVALAAGVAAATTGGLAATGSLPDPAQHFVHDVGEHLGIDVPDAPGHLPGDPASPYAPGHVHPHHAPGHIGRDAQDPAPVVPLGPSPAPDGEDTTRDEVDRDRPQDRAGGPRTPVVPEAPADPGQAPAGPGQAPADPAQDPADPGQAPVDPAQDPADPVPAPDAPPGADAGSDAPGSDVPGSDTPGSDAGPDAPGDQAGAEQPPPRSSTPDQHDPPDQQDAPAPSGDPEASGDAPGRRGEAPPEDAGAPADGRP